MNDEPEEWRKVPDFPAYSISNLGRVRRDLGVRTSKAGKILRGQFRTGYPSVTLRQNGKTIIQNIHRLLALTFLGPPPSPKHQVAHGDGDRTNFSLANLRWASAAENCGDKVTHGTLYNGVRHHRCKISPAVVLEIRKRRREGELYSIMAREYGLNKTTVARIDRREKWKSV